MVRDQTLALLREGYRWAPARRAGAVAVPTRLLGRRAALVAGPDGVRAFYSGRLRRRHAVPAAIKLVLFGAGAVHGLDDLSHHVRKAMFVDALGAAAVADLERRTGEVWRERIRRGPPRGRRVTLEDVVDVLARAVLPWAGVTEDEETTTRRGRQLATIVDGFASPVLPYAWSWWARLTTDRWLRRVVGDTRAGRRTPAAGTALAAVASHRDADGRLLPTAVAAVELHNVVRPSLAVSWFVAHAARALAEQPDWASRIRGGDQRALDAFVEEVRRFFPFVPVLAARTRTATEVLGVALRRGDSVVLDVYGTNHDPGHWTAPDTFDPGRFERGEVDRDAFVPQGGGDVQRGHRCPGEDVTRALLRASVRALVALPVVPTVSAGGLDLDRVPARP